MKSFTEWVKSEGLGTWWHNVQAARMAGLEEKERKQERRGKLYQMRVWLGQGAKGIPPVKETDPDYAWIKAKMDKLGPASPSQDDMGPWGYGAGVNPGA